MKQVLHEIRVGLWFLRRPKLHPVLLRKVKKRIVGTAHPDTRAEAEKWCEERAVGTQEALEQLTGTAPEQSVREYFEEEFREAQRRVNMSSEALGGPGNVDILYRIAEYLEARKVVETGVAYGWSALSLLLSLQHRSDAMLISTDMPQILSTDDNTIGCAVPDNLRSKWKIIRRADREALPMALAELGTIDLCHYDSDKTHEGRLWAYPRLWEALRPGGIFISDDIGDNVAFRNFAQEVDVTPLVINTVTPRNEQYVGVLQKPDS